MLGDTTSVFDAGWPAYDAALAAEDRVTMAVQVNGKTRGTIAVAKDSDAGRGDGGRDGRSRASRSSSPATPKKVIFVPGRLLNVIV